MEMLKALQELGVNVSPIVILYILMIGAVTKWIVKCFKLIKARHAQVISLGIALIIAVADGLVTHIGIGQIIIRAFIFAFLANGGYDAIRLVGSTFPGGKSKSDE